MTPAVIGASVNLAARLEQATRELGSDMVISIDFAQKLHQEIPVCAPVLMAQYSQMDSIHVKGLSEPVAVLYRPSDQS